MDNTGAARRAMEAGDFHVAAFLAQQVAVPSMKALWIERKRELAPRTHELSQLATGLGTPKELETGLLLLDPAYVNTRYPDAANGVPSRIYNGEIAARLIECAEQAFEWCRSQLGVS